MAEPHYAHDHGHDHEHSHAHDHSHGHTHERTLNLGYATAELSSHMHDQASTVSVTIKLNEGSAIEFSGIPSALQVVAERAEAAGGIIGHIKGYAETTSGFAHASCTDASQGVATQGELDLVIDVASNAQIVAIVMLIDLHELENIVIEALSSNAEFG